jgi:hypothetical protein
MRKQVTSSAIQSHHVGTRGSKNLRKKATFTHWSALVTRVASVAIFPGNALKQSTRVPELDQGCLCSVWNVSETPFIWQSSAKG